MKQEIAQQNHVEMIVRSEVEQERQAYLDELKIDSQQFGAGRTAEQLALE